MKLKRIWLFVVPQLLLLSAFFAQSCGNGLFGTLTECGQSINPFEFAPLISCTPPSPTPGPPGPQVSSLSLCPAPSSSTSASPTPCPSFVATSIPVGGVVEFELVATLSDGTTADYTDAPTVLWSNSNPSVLAPAPTPSPSPGVYEGVCPGTANVSASVSSGVTSQQVSVSVTGSPPSGCPTASPSSSPTTAAQIRVETALQESPRLQWVFRAQPPIGTAILAPPETSTVYFVGGERMLYAVDSSGALLWSRSVAGPALALGANGTVYAETGASVVEAIERSGLTLWQAELEGEIVTLASENQGTVYAATTTALYSFNADGTLNWTIQGLQASAIAASPTGGVNVATIGGPVAGISGQGKQIWSFSPAGGFAGAIAVDQDGNVYAGSESGVLYALSPQGQLLWEVQTPAPVKAGPVIAPDGSVAFVADQLYVLSQSGMTLWQSPLIEPAIGNVVITATAQGVAVSELGGSVLSVAPATNSSTWLQINGAISALASGPSGELYLGSQQGYVYRVR